MKKITICVVETLLGILIFSIGLLRLGGGVAACGCGDTEFRPPPVTPEGVANELSLPCPDPGVTLLLLYSAAATRSDMFCVLPGARKNALNFEYNVIFHVYLEYTAKAVFYCTLIFNSQQAKGNWKNT